MRAQYSRKNQSARGCFFLHRHNKPHQIWTPSLERAAPVAEIRPPPDSRCFPRVANPENCTLSPYTHPHANSHKSQKHMWALPEGQTPNLPSCRALMQYNHPSPRVIFWDFVPNPPTTQKLDHFIDTSFFCVVFGNFSSYIPLLQPTSVPKYEAKPTQVESHNEGEDERDALASRRLEKKPSCGVSCLSASAVVDFADIPLLSQKKVI